MKAPLILGTDLTNMSAATYATITNKAAISVSKDPLAEQGVMRISSEWLPASKHGGGVPSGHMVWSGALSKGGVAAALLNLNTAPQEITMTELELPESRATREGLGAAAGAGKWEIKEAFSGRVQCASCSLPQTVTVAPHDVALWVMAPASA
jgi:hypothetical protein